MKRGFSNKSVERTGMSRSAQGQLQRQRRLIPVAHLFRSAASASWSGRSDLGVLISLRSLRSLWLCVEIFNAEDAEVRREAAVSVVTRPSLRGCRVWQEIFE